MTLTVGSLFSGIGGLDLGLERAGMKVIWQSEIDPYCNKILKKHWPEVINHGNIKDIDWGTIERPDIICGGYPCQPFSTAGKRRGTDDPRHLWPWVRDAIIALRPDYAILENVRGHLTMGGLQVIGELTEIGYDAEWRVVSAAGLGAPHRRDRIIIVAYPNDSGNRTSERRIDTHGKEKIKEQENISQSWVSRCSTKMANTNSEFMGQHWSQSNVADKSQIWDNQRNRKKTNDIGQWWKIEPNVGRVAHGISSRVDRLRSLGNAVVPQVAEYIGRLVVDHAMT
jgi:DNA (cytosine-5)-methyltransferase 1